MISGPKGCGKTAYLIWHAFRNQNILAINYAINLVNYDILRTRRKYYKLMCKEGYGKKID